MKLKNNLYHLGLIGLLLAFSISMTGCAAMAPINLPTFNAKRPVPNPRGGCNIQYELNNTFDFTLSLFVDVTLMNEQGNTLGSASAQFPPILPGRSGIIQVPVYPFNLSSGTCNGVKQLRIKAKHCKSVDDGRYVVDRICNQIRGSHVIQ